MVAGKADTLQTYLRKVASPYGSGSNISGALHAHIPRDEVLRSPPPTMDRTTRRYYYTQTI